MFLRRTAFTRLPAFLAYSLEKIESSQSHICLEGSRGEYLKSQKHRKYSTQEIQRSLKGPKKE